MIKKEDFVKIMQEFEEFDTANCEFNKAIEKYSSGERSMFCYFPIYHTITKLLSCIFDVSIDTIDYFVCDNMFLKKPADIWFVENKKEVHVHVTNWEEAYDYLLFCSEKMKFEDITYMMVED